MPPISADQQVSLLVSCIRWSTNGKINFEEVAKELNIASKGAAAKRYDRLLKSHGIARGGNVDPASSSPVKDEADDTDTATAENTPMKKATPAKRKAAAEKDPSTPTPTKKGKGERRSVVEASAEKLVAKHGNTSPSVEKEEDIDSNNNNINGEEYSLSNGEEHNCGRVSNSELGEGEELLRRDDFSTAHPPSVSTPVHSASPSGPVNVSVSKSNSTSKSQHTPKSKTKPKPKPKPKSKSTQIPNEDNEVVGEDYLAVSVKNAEILAPLFLSSPLRSDDTDSVFDVETQMHTPSAQAVFEEFIAAREADENDWYAADRRRRRAKMFERRNSTVNRNCAWLEET